MSERLSSAVLELLLFTQCPHPSPTCTANINVRCKCWHHPQYIVMVKDASERVTWMNETAVRLTGQRPSEEERVPTEVLLIPEQAAASRERDEQVMRTGQPVWGQHWNPTMPNGLSGWIVEDTFRHLNSAGKARVYTVSRVLSVDRALARQLGAPEIPPPPPVKPGEELKQCAQCGMPYIPKRRWQRYCSTSCRQIAFWERHKR